METSLHVSFRLSLVICNLRRASISYLKCSTNNTKVQIYVVSHFAQKQQKKKRKKENLQALLLLLWNALIVTLNVTVLAALVAANLHNVDKVQACRGGDRSGVRVGLLKPELFHSISPSAMGITICSHQISLETWHCKEVKAKVFIPRQSVLSYMNIVCNASEGFNFLGAFSCDQYIFQILN